MSTNFIGVDAGGTATRALLADAQGNVLGLGRAGGANAWSSGRPLAETLGSAIADALGTTDRATVAGGVIAIAGGGATSARFREHIVGGWSELGLAGAPDITVDVVAAYASATVAPRGVVVTSGTGSIAALVDGGSIERRAGGYGWLLGDEGSAVWLGREACAATLRALDRAGPTTRLRETIPAALGVEADGAQQASTGVIDAVYSHQPAELGRLAPVVVAAADGGDAVAQRLLAEAAEALVAIAVAAAGGTPPPVVVLGGSVLTAVPTIQRSVRASVADRWPAAGVLTTSSGEAGAAALALARASGGSIGADVLARLQTGAASADADAG